VKVFDPNRQKVPQLKEIILYKRNQRTDAVIVATFGAARRVRERLFVGPSRKRLARREDSNLRPLAPERDIRGDLSNVAA